MKDKMKSFVKGILLGIVGKPLPISQGKEPVAYLYNGVRLPKLPKWDKAQFPYAVIAYDIENAKYDLYCDAVPMSHITYSTSATEEVDFTGKKVEGYYMWQTLYSTLADGKWSEPAYGDYGGFQINYLGTALANVVWANHDIPTYLYVKGTGRTPTGKLCIAASEPVPVYE